LFSDSLHVTREVSIPGIKTFLGSTKHTASQCHSDVDQIWGKSRGFSMAWRASIVERRDVGSDRSMEGKLRNFVAHGKIPNV
jgi:hypothetical protein